MIIDRLSSCRTHFPDAVAGSNTSQELAKKVQRFIESFRALNTFHSHDLVDFQGSIMDLHRASRKDPIQKSLKEDIQTIRTVLTEEFPIFSAHNNAPIDTSLLKAATNFEAQKETSSDLQAVAERLQEYSFATEIMLKELAFISDSLIDS